MFASSKSGFLRSRKSWKIYRLATFKDYPWPCNGSVAGPAVELVFGGIGDVSLADTVGEIVDEGALPAKDPVTTEGFVVVKTNAGALTLAIEPISFVPPSSGIEFTAVTVV